MSAHTPGPWSQGGLKTKDKHWMRSVNAGYDGVAWCGAGDDATAHANARLIAAAPELLAILREVVEHGSDLPTDIIFKAVSAIQKAEGIAK